MKILIIGGRGTIGKRLVEHISKKHDDWVGGRSEGEVIIDINYIESLENAFKNDESYDAVIVAAGEAKWAPFSDLSEADFHIGLNSKLMGQINVVRMANKYLKSNSSVTLKTGILADDTVYMKTSAAMVNGAIHSFVKAVYLDINRRFKVVAPGLVYYAAVKYDGYFPGHIPVKMKDLVMYYEKSVEGLLWGEVLRIY